VDNWVEKAAFPPDTVEKRWIIGDPVSAARLFHSEKAAQMGRFLRA